MSYIYTKVTQDNFERRFKALTRQPFSANKEAAISLLRDILAKREIQVQEIKDLIIHLDPRAPEDSRNLLSDKAHWRLYRRAAIQD